MRLSAERTGTIDELLLVEAARFLLTQTDRVKTLQEELDDLTVENHRLTHQRSDYDPFPWNHSPLAKIITQHTPTK